MGDEVEYKVGRGRPPKHGQIKKGEKRNPLGQKAHDPIKKKIKLLTSQELMEVASLVLAKDQAALNEICKFDANGKFKTVDKSNSVLKIWLASIALHGLRAGDNSRFEALLNRLIGPVKQEVQHSNPDGSAVQPVVIRITMPSNGREKA